MTKYVIYRMRCKIMCDTGEELFKMPLNQTLTKKDVFQQYKIILEDWIPHDATILIALNDTYVYFESSKHLEVGTLVKEESIAHRVLKNREKTDTIIESTLFPEPYFGIGYPIVVDGELGALVILSLSNFSKPEVNPYRFLTGKQNEDWCPVQIDQISHIESLQKRTWFYKEGEQYKTSITLKELQTRLPNTFLRIHRSYIINILFIKKISRDITSSFIILLKDGTELPVSQSYVNDLRSLLEF